MLINQQANKSHGVGWCDYSWILQRNYCYSIMEIGKSACGINTKDLLGHLLVLTCPVIYVKGNYSNPTQAGLQMAQAFQDWRLESSYQVKKHVSWSVCWRQRKYRMGSRSYRHQLDYVTAYGNENYNCHEYFLLIFLRICLCVCICMYVYICILYAFPGDCMYMAFLVTQTVKNLPAMCKSQVWSLGRKDPLEGNGNPPQYSCLENSITKTTVHGVAKSWTWLSNWHTYSISLENPNIFPLS